MTRLTAVFLTLLPLSAVAQTATPALAFDVVSIKQNHEGPGPMMVISPLDSDRIIVRNASARAIIGEAYGIRLHDLIVGVPVWADSDAWDMDAKVAAADVPAFQKLLPMQPESDAAGGTGLSGFTWSAIRSRARCPRHMRWWWQRVAQR